MNASLCALLLSCGVLIGAAKGLQTVIVDTGSGVACFEVEIAENV